MRGSKWIIIFLLALLFSCELFKPRPRPPIPQDQINEADSLIMLLGDSIA